MDRGLKWRAGLVIFTILLGALYVVPNFVPEGSLPEWFPSKKMNLGLDLQGGLLLQYSVEVEKAVSDKVDRMKPELENRIREKKPDAKFKVQREGLSGLKVQFEDPADTALLDTRFMWDFPNMDKTDLGPGSLLLQMPEETIARLKEGAVDKALETIRGRIDAFGVAEPDIRKGREGTEIIVQLPGLSEKDFNRAKDMIGRTAQLEFRMCDDEGASAWVEQHRGSIPRGSDGQPTIEVINDGGLLAFKADSRTTLEEFVKGKADDDHYIGFENVQTKKNIGSVQIAEGYWKTIYLKKAAPLTGEFISDAGVAVDQRDQRPYVSLTFDSHGARIFGELTTANVKKRMAIMLDDVVNSAPVINEPITGGRAQITMGGWRSNQELFQEARDLVTVLEHGALPAPVQKEFETRVGPTLGADSIEAGKISMIIGFLAVVCFMAFYYRWAGMVANLALLLNALFMLAGLTAFEATLTLPGMAGIVLTLGMAVDANVIINERIREELRLGKTPRSAVEAGYGKAWTAIFDANLTTVIAGLVLYGYGTGPIRGFAVTLLMGIVSSMFTAIFVTRVVFETFVNRRRIERLSI